MHLHFFLLRFACVICYVVKSQVYLGHLRKMVQQGLVGYSMRLKIEAGCGILEILKARCRMPFRRQDSG